MREIKRLMNKYPHISFEEIKKGEIICGSILSVEDMLKYKGKVREDGRFLLTYAVSPAPRKAAPLSAQALTAYFTENSIPYIKGNYHGYVSARALLGLSEEDVLARPNINWHDIRGYCDFMVDDDPKYYEDLPYATAPDGRLQVLGRSSTYYSARRKQEQARRVILDNIVPRYIFACGARDLEKMNEHLLEAGLIDEDSLLDKDMIPASSEEALSHLQYLIESKAYK